MKRLLLVLFLLPCSAYVVASGQINNAKVSYIRIDSDGRGIIFFDQPIGNTPPACVISAYASALSFNSSGAGKGVLAVALAAKAQDRPMTVYGNGTCSTYGNYVEDVDVAMIL
jgi:hypothetical protein